MERKIINEERIVAFARHLTTNDELAPGSVEQYVRAVRRLSEFLGGRPISKELTVARGEHPAAWGTAVRFRIAGSWRRSTTRA